MAGVYRFTVSGRVQGVGFRQATRQQALALGLGGWVRNTTDGRVEGQAAGTPQALDALHHWLAQGPPAAEVLRLDWQPDARSTESWSGLSDFVIRP